MPVWERYKRPLHNIRRSCSVVEPDQASTQIPKICLAMGRGDEGRIGHTQPRRIAAKIVVPRIVEKPGVSTDFHHAPVIEVSGRGYPVELRVRPV
jgi:HrpA-like helicases